MTAWAISLRAMDSAHAMLHLSVCHLGNSHHAFHFWLTRNATLPPELASKKALTSVISVVASSSWLIFDI
jgi:hypothetical protein